MGARFFIPRSYDTFPNLILHWLSSHVGTSGTDGASIRIRANTRK